FALDALLLSLSGGVLAGILVGVALAASDRLARLAPRTRQATWKALLLSLCVAPFCALAAARMFARRRAQSLPAHPPLALAGGLGLFYLTAQRRGKRIGRLAEPWLALGISLLAVAGGAFALRRLARDEAVRAAVYQHSLIEARWVDLARAAGIAPQSIAPAPP